MLVLPDIRLGHGSGSSLPFPVLALAGVSTIIAVIVSGVSISLQLRNYRKPLLQRMVVRIMVMVPLYAVSSLISLFSLEAAFFIDVVRDIYEAFVIYCFFVLLLDYLGGERSLLILLHGRPPIPAVFPVSLWRNEIDPSDPYTFLFLKRGILQYVQVKPLLALASLVMKATGTYNEGDFRARSGYLYVSIVYNISICLALWCLAVFWMCVHQDLKPFRPVPKFLCVKGILFFSFWQSIAVSFLVAVGVITRLGPYTDREHISLGLTDTLICIEMPFFAAAHMYAFSYRDFVQSPASAPPSVPSKPRAPMYVARMTLGYALRDAVGLKDLVEDTRATLRGEGINYRAFEPSEGAMHIGAARDRRIRAGLRYAAGGRHKYWLPADGEDVGAPLLEDAEVHGTRGDGDDDDGHGDEYGLTFSDDLAVPGGVDEELYAQAKRYVFGDYLYPVVDISSEEARRAMWDEEERVVREIAAGGFGRSDTGSGHGYGATQHGERRVRMYEDDGDAARGSSSTRVSRTPSPPRSPLRSRGTPRPECLPVSAAGSAHPSPSHSPRGLTRLHLPLPKLPRLLSSSSIASASSSVSTSSSVPRPAPRVSKRMREPLVAEDAVDLVVPAPEGLQVPTTYVHGGSHSPRSPLIRVWDELNEGHGEGTGAGEGGSGTVASVGVGQGGEDRRKEAVEVSRPVRFVMRVEDGEGGVRPRSQPQLQLQTGTAPGYVPGIPEVDEGNPWA